MILTILEVASTPNSTASQLLMDNKHFCFVIEDGYREKKVKKETRIGAGRFPVVPVKFGRFFEAYKKKFGHKFALLVKNVPGFDGIMIHIGNYIKDTDGCPLVNRSIGMGVDGNFFGSDSTSVYKLLYSLIDAALERGEEIWLEVIRNNEKTA